MHPAIRFFAQNNKVKLGSVKIVVFYIFQGMLFYSIQLNLYAEHTEIKVKKMLANDLSKGNLFAISDILNKQLGLLEWSCLKGKSGQGIFLKMRSSYCAPGLFNEDILIQKKERPDIQVTMLLRLPRDQEGIIIATFFLLSLISIFSYILIHYYGHKLIKLEMSKAQEIQNISYKVAHDIRSPLEVLKALKERYMIKEELFTIALSRIEGISEALLNKRKSNDLKEYKLHELINPILLEKNLYKKIVFNQKGPFSKEIFVNKNEFMAILSNLISNSIEARASRILLEVQNKHSKYCLIIQDNGNGIPEKVLPKLFNEEVTHGKKDGNGIGLFQAKKYLKQWGADIRLIKSSKEGTAFEVSFPKKTAITS